MTRPGTSLSENMVSIFKMACLLHCVISILSSLQWYELYLSNGNSNCRHSLPVSIRINTRVARLEEVSADNVCRLEAPSQSDSATNVVLQFPTSEFTHDHMLSAVSGHSTGCYSGPNAPPQFDHWPLLDFFSAQICVRMPKIRLY